MGSSRNTISVSNLGIRFPDRREKHRGIRSAIGRGLQCLLKRQARGSSESNWFWALKNVTFDLPQGRSLGIIGLNGAGKTTLIKCLAGIYWPSEGVVYVRGAVTPVFGVNPGFAAELSGRENVILSGLLLGFSKSDIERIAPDIIEFAGVGEAIDRPVKYYSAGMKARLGFAVVSLLEPEILLLDEMLGAGDKSFKKRCQERIDEMLSKARTIVLCSHNMELVRNLCDLTVWLHRGRLRMFGPTEQVVSCYEQFVEEEEGWAEGDRGKLRAQAA